MQATSLPNFHRPAARCGLSLLELVVSMGLLSLLMLPIVGLLSTSRKTYAATSDRLDGDYARQSSLDGATWFIRDGSAAVAINPTRLRIQFAGGGNGELRFASGRLTWTIGGTTQVLSTGLVGARFQIINTGPDPTAGQLVQLEVATRGPTEPAQRWSTTQIWIRPII